MEVLKNLDFWFQKCKDNLCGMECEHVPQIQYWGKLYGDIIHKERKERKKIKMKLAKEEPFSKQKQRIDIEEVKLLIEEGMVNSEIAEFLMVDYENLMYYFKKYKIKNENKKPDEHAGVALTEILKRFSDGMENYEIIRYYGFNPNGYRAFLRKHKLKNPNYSKRGKK